MPMLPKVTIGPDGLPRRKEPLDPTAYITNYIGLRNENGSLVATFYTTDIDPAGIPGRYGYNIYALAGKISCIPDITSKKNREQATKATTTAMIEMVTAIAAGKTAKDFAPLYSPQEARARNKWFAQGGPADQERRDQTKAVRAPEPV